MVPRAFEVAFQLRSHSHRLSAEAFDLLTSGDSCIRVRVDSDRTCTATCVNIVETTASLDQFVPVAHVCLSWLLVALNVAAVGHFSWENSASFLGSYTATDPERSDADRAIGSQLPARVDDLRDLSALDVRRAALLAWSLMREPVQTIRHEYVKGLIHLDLTHFDSSFEKDAFHNFYRTAEFLMVTRYCAGRPPKNELREFTLVLARLGASAPLIDEFKSLYRIRGDQVGHAQKAQRDLEPEVAMKMKVMTDFILYRAYRDVFWANHKTGPQ